MMDRSNLHLPCSRAAILNKHAETIVIAAANHDQDRMLIRSLGLTNQSPIVEALDGTKLTNIIAT